MKKYPSVYNLKTFLHTVNSGASVEIKKGYWAPARPVGYISFWHRIQCAWQVFIGKADAVIWPQDEEIK